MWKIIARIAAAVAVVLLLLGGSAQAAELPGSADSPDRTAAGSGGAGGAGSTDAAPGDQTGETKAVVVGTLAFVLMVGTGGAVLWYTARKRHLPE